MKFYRTKHFALITLIWGMITILILLSQFKDSILLDRGVEKAFYQFIVSAFIYIALIGVGLVYLKRESNLPWKEFLKTDFDRFAEDDRITALENEIKHKCSNMIIATTFVCVCYLVGWKHQTMFSAKEVLLLCGILMTVYFSFNYVLVRRAYESDTIDSFMNKPTLMGIVLAILVLILWSVLV